MAVRTTLLIALVLASSPMMPREAAAHCNKEPTTVTLTLAGSGSNANRSMETVNAAAAAFKAALQDMTKAKTQAELAAARDRALASIEAHRIAYAAWAGAKGLADAEANVAKGKQAAAEIAAYAKAHMAGLKA